MAKILDNHLKSVWGSREEADRVSQIQQISIEGSRERFLVECRSGVHDGVFAISRTYDSVNVRLHYCRTSRFHWKITKAKNLARVTDR